MSLMRSQVTGIALPRTGQRILPPPTASSRTGPAQRVHSISQLRGTNGLPPLQRIITLQAVPAQHQSTSQQQQQWGPSAPAPAARNGGGSQATRTSHATHQPSLMRQQGHRQQQEQQPFHLSGPTEQHPLSPLGSATADSCTFRPFEMVCASG